MNLRPDEESTGELICNPSTIILPLQHPPLLDGNHFGGDFAQ